MSETLKQHSAGGLVYRKQDNHIDIIMIRDAYGKWTFPKGHLELGETAQEAARREISEEVGIDASLLTYEAELGTIEYAFESNFRRDLDASGLDGVDRTVTIHKYVTYFLFEHIGTTELSHQSSEVETAEWVPLAEVIGKNEYDDNEPIIARAMTIFSKLNI